MQKHSNSPSDNSFRTSIGGQALIEGILMRGPHKQAIVVRRPDGEMEIKEEPLKLIKDRHPILGVPFIRGTVNFMDSMVKGVQALMYSAEFYPEEEEEEPSKFEIWLEQHLGTDAFNKAIIYLAVALGVGFSVVLFILLPALVFGLLQNVIPSFFIRNLLEGATRIVIFFIYLILCSKQQDMKRVFAYHGAEHKTIYCYERRLPLTVENVRDMPRHHPRCGTSFLFVVMVIAILIFSVVQVENVVLQLFIKLLLLPVVVGITYEINRWMGRHDNLLSRVCTAPGMWMQNFTTNEPDDSMIECAIEAMKRVIPEQDGADAW
ncbi:MAG: DUF1385 domain-containing protein [Oscillospiraceae bacterium]|nr:DUF1385 domain-containing protein [Oscillospiraceae bacterium]